MGHHIISLKKRSLFRKTPKAERTRMDKKVSKLVKQKKKLKVLPEVIFLNKWDKLIIETNDSYIYRGCELNRHRWFVVEKILSIYIV